MSYIKSYLKSMAEETEMLGIDELKESIEITDTKVECPVKGCSNKVERQRVAFRREEKFKCPKHNIFISTTSFEYQNGFDNLLWKNHDDLFLLNQIKTVKRESRIGRDTSEDAVSWNIFRFLENNNMICDFLEKKFNIIEENPEIIYWSYSQSQAGLWEKLKEARKEFESRPSKGSEPDIIIVGKNTLMIIEAKFNATNRTPFNHQNPTVERKYMCEGENWWDEVFCSDFKKVVIDANKYELSRFWLIGTWMAQGRKQKQNLDFYLVNLVLKEKKEKENIESIFNKHIKTNQKRIFRCFTWEEIYDYISSSNLPMKNRDMMMKYFRNKTIGYYNGRLKKAFSIPEQES